MLRWLPLPAILLACGAPVPSSGAFLLSPTDEALPLVEAAVQAWGAVAPLEIGPGGAKVELVDKVYDLDGVERCGATIFYQRSGRVEVQITRAGKGCAPMPLLMLHEVGHVLCGGPDCHLEPGQKGGMGERCNPSGPADVIDQPSEDVVCAQGDCFEPT